LQLQHFAGCHFGVRLESGGGLKITNTKINANAGANVWTNGIDVHLGAGVVSGDLLISNTSIEGYGGSGSGIKLSAADSSSFYRNILIDGVQFGRLARRTAALPCLSRVVPQINLCRSLYQAAPHLHLQPVRAPLTLLTTPERFILTRTISRLVMRNWFPSLTLPPQITISGTLN
jgi:hypothetical protein